jgi:serine/threonine protein kinase
VYKGTEQDKRSVDLAIKVQSTFNAVKNYGGDKEKMLKYLENEISILSKINHKNVVKLEEFIKTANNYYLIFEFCNGGDLHKYLKDHGPLSEVHAQSFLF